MKITMIKSFITTIVLSTFFFCDTYSQLPNQNMYLLKNLNQHSTGNLYSAIWGYKAPDGREYGILGCGNGTAFIDITDSANIREVGFLAGPSSTIREMKTYSHYAYITSEAFNSAVQIVDLQYLPDSIHFVKKFVAPMHSTTHTISQSGPYLYLNGANSSFVPSGGIGILDLSMDPENPILRGKWTTRYVHDCRIINDTIWTADIVDGRISVINATNKNTPATITSWFNQPNSGPHNTALTENRKRLFVTDEIGQPPNLVRIWNIENLSNPIFVRSWQPTGITTSISHNIEIYENFGIVAHYSAGVRVINIANPDVPTEVAWYDTYPSNNSSSFNGCWGVYKFPSGKIIASDRQTGFYALKTTFPLSSVGNTTATNIPKKFSLNQNYPNPFNPTTSITFNIPKNSFVTLKVYSLNGKEVANVINDRRDAGNYEITFDANKYGLASGSYFYTLQSEGLKETKRMILIK